MTAAKSEKDNVADYNLAGYWIETRWMKMVYHRDVGLCIYRSFETTLSMNDLDNLLSVNHCQKE